MKHLFLSIFTILFIWACSTQKRVVKIEENKEESELVSDSLIYKLETFDAKFESWYLLQNKPSQYRSQQYYENWNRQYVSAWNHKSMSQRKNNFFEPIIGYEP